VSNGIPINITNVIFNGSLIGQYAAGILGVALHYTQIFMDNISVYGNITSPRYASALIASLTDNS
jgi:hypothetical protein